MIRAFPLYSWLVIVHVTTLSFGDHDLFLCKNGRVTSLDDVCDFTEECGYDDDDVLCFRYERCDFETDLCGMTNEGWSRTNRLSNPNAPSDHRSNDTAYFLALSSDNPPGTSSLLRSVTFLPTTTSAVCLLRFYYFVPEVNARLSLQVESQSGYNDIWVTEDFQGQEWRRFIRPVSSSEPFKVVFKGAVFSRDQSDTVAIDDISFSEGCRPANESILSCELEEGPCFWSSDPSSEQISWRHTSRSPGPILDAPSVYNTSGSIRGHFMFVEGSLANLHRKVYLRSPPYRSSSSSPACHFYFPYMIEEDNGLRLLLYADEEEVLLFEENAPTNGQWVEGKVHLPGNSKDIQLSFEGTVRSINGFIALAGFQLTGCETSRGEPVISDNESCFSTDSTCDFQRDCTDESDEDANLCNNFNRCDFESGFCEWKPVNTNGLTWTISERETSHDGILTGKDHTLHTEDGHFAYFSADSAAGMETASAQLESEFLVNPLPEAGCQIQFWYQLSDNSKISIIKKSVVNQDWQLLQEFTQYTYGTWTKAIVQMEPGSLDTTDSYQITLEATLLSGPAAAAIDDISLSPDCGVINLTRSDQVKEPLFAICPHGWSLLCGNGTCLPWSKRCDFTKDCEHGLDELFCPAKCDFELTSCGWHNEWPIEKSFYWVRQSPSRLRPEYSAQAPSLDHTTNSTKGHFMFIQKKNSNGSQIASLWSPKFSQAGTGCSLIFWYYNSGLSVGVVEIHLHIENENSPTLLWRTYYNQGNQWWKGIIQLDRLSHPFHLSVNKISVGLYEGVSAIDDVVFENCSLPPPASSCNGTDHFWCADTRACISSLQVCDLIDDCGDGSDEINCTSELQCDFEDGLCNWSQDKEDDFDWTRYQGQTPTLDTGPMKDHTIGTVRGHYLYIETSEPQMYKNQAVLLSPEIDATVNNNNKTCIFRFYYHMYGKQIYSLAVHKRTLRNTRGQLLWQAFGNKGNWWLKKVLFINSSLPFQLLITGSVGDGFTGDIAIDDLSFLNCTLYKGALPTWAPIPPETPTVPTLPVHNCTANEHVCRSSGQCIPSSKLCDFREDCADGSDETNCVSEYCDFENETVCNWFQPGVSVFRRDAAFHWEVGQGMTRVPGEETHRPALDHTTSSEEGWYLYADSSNGEFGHTAYIMTPLISHTGPKCTLTFWTYMDGATVGSLQVLIHFGNMTYELWTQSGKQGALWKRAEVYLGTLNHFQIVLRAKRGVSYVGDVVVDDISFENCSPMLIQDESCTSEEFMCANKYCVPKDSMCDFMNDCSDYSDENIYTCRNYLGRCNFEFDLCDWKQDKTDNFDWNLRAGSTPTLGTGPVTDHTLQNPSGSYIFIEGSFPHLPFQVARLSGPVVSKWSRNCKLIFYFHMYGEGIGSLAVHQVSVSREATLLLNLTGNQGNYWQRKELELFELAEDFYVRFEGKVGRDHRGDIAMDDIVLSNECLPSSISGPDSYKNQPTLGFCLSGSWRCKNMRCYKPEQRCDFVDDCGDNTDEQDCGTSCTFEQGLCGWRRSLSDNFDWVLGEYSSLRPQIIDHTLGNEDGHFLFLETSSIGLRGEKAHMKSATWKESAEDCKLSFWYYMSAKATGQIRVLIQTETSLKTLWGVSENLDAKWNRVEIPLGKLRHFKVIFEGVRTKDFGGGAAIDDIEYIDCSPAGEVPGKCPEDTDFVCRNKKCIEQHLVCDYKSDCADASDEADCGVYMGVPGSCSFENLSPDGQLECDLSQDQTDDFDWIVAERGVQINSDHTPGNGRLFLYANTSNQKAGDTARIVTSSLLPVTYETCRVRFWYYIYGPLQSAILKVFIVTDYGLKILQWSAMESTGRRWMYSSIVLSSSSPFRVAFEAQLGAKASMDIALDDISFTLDCHVEEPVTPKPACPEDMFTCIYEKECIPISARCNDTKECKDGSDEIFCPTTTPSTPPQQHCKTTEFQCAKKCIPLMMWCDGVIDCLQEEDENNCSATVAANGSFLCIPSNTWLSPDLRCDGKADCSNHIDESLCSVCPIGYCKNNGNCVVQKQVPVCRCKKQWQGERCHIRSPSIPPDVTETDARGMWIGVGIGLTCLLLEIVLAFLCYFCKGRRHRGDITGGFSNPNYAEGSMTSQNELSEAKHPNVHISVFPWQTVHETSKKAMKAYAFPNPLYGQNETDA